MAAPVPEALSKARAYCARQERCQQEVRDKLYGWGAHKGEVEPIIARLIAERYLDEKRFAEHFAVSKFRQKGWGRRKIEMALKGKRVSAPCIKLALRGIDDDEYSAGLNKAVAKRWEKVKEANAFIKRQKVMRYFIGRGYAVEQVEKAIKGLE